MLADLGDVFERFVVGADEKHGGPEASAEAFEGPDDTTGLQVEGSPGLFVVECGSADKRDGEDGAVGLFLLEGGTEAVQAGVTVQAEGAGVVGDGVPVRVDQDRRTDEFSESSDDGFHFRSKTNLTPCLSRASMERSRVESFFKNLR